MAALRFSAIPSDESGSALGVSVNPHPGFEPGNPLVQPPRGQINRSILAAGKIHTI